MKYKQLLLPIATLLISLLQTIKSEAQNGDIAARINPILSYSTARDGHIAFDTFFAPLKTGTEQMSLRGQVSQVIQKINVKSDYTYGHTTDTISFNRKGNFTRIVSPKVDQMTPGKKYPDTHYSFLFNGDICTGYVFREWNDNANFNHPIEHRDVITYEYDQKNRLSKQWQKVYFEEKDGKLHESLQGFTKDPMLAMEYDLEGRPNAASVGSDERVKYDFQGRLTLWMYMNNTDVKASEFLYNTQGLLSSTKYYSLDGMDEVEYIETSSSISYNEKGDITKITTTSWTCNNKWVHMRRLNTTTTNYTYSYDQKNNWTRVAIKETVNGRTVPKGTIERAITYWSKGGSDQTKITIPENKDPNHIYDLAEVPPSFPGGNKALHHYIRGKIQYPEEAKTNKQGGRVIISIVIEKDGTVSNAKVSKGTSYEALNNEALRIINSMPKWIPGKVNNKDVRARVAIPVTFTPEKREATGSQNESGNVNESVSRNSPNNSRNGDSHGGGHKPNKDEKKPKRQYEDKPAYYTDFSALVRIGTIEYAFNGTPKEDIPPRTVIDHPFGMLPRIIDEYIAPLWVSATFYKDKTENDAICKRFGNLVNTEFKKCTSAKIPTYVSPTAPNINIVKPFHAAWIQDYPNVFPFIKNENAFITMVLEAEMDKSWVELPTGTTMHLEALLMTPDGYVLTTPVHTSDNKLLLYVRLDYTSAYTFNNITQIVILNQLASETFTNASIRQGKISTEYTKRLNTYKEKVRKRYKNI